VTEADQGKDWLSTTLRGLRRHAGLSGAEVARRIGTSQRRVSDLERGKYVPREDEIGQLADLYGAKATVRRQMLRAVRDLTAEPTRARVMIARHGAYKMQQRAQRTEAESAQIRSFHPSVVIGLAQTPAYMRAVFSAGGDLAAADMEKSIAARIVRQEILGTGKDISLIMTEGALRWQAGSPQVMIEQIDAITAATELPNVDIGIIPFSAPAIIFPRHGFHLYDSDAVVVGTETGTATITDAEDITSYEQMFTQLQEIASMGPGARPILDRIAADYRNL